MLGRVKVSTVTMVEFPNGPVEDVDDGELPVPVDSTLMLVIEDGMLLESTPVIEELELEERDEPVPVGPENDVELLGIEK